MLICPSSMISLTEFDKIVKNPQSIVSLLGQSVPGTGLFFTNYVMLQGSLLLSFSDPLILSQRHPFPFRCSKLRL
jgi:hypothetical protein